MGISDWADMMPETIQIADVSSRDGYGKPTYGSDTNYSARITYKSQMVTDANGDEVMAKGEIWVARTTDVQADSRITLPISAQPTSTPKVINTELIEDESGPHHVKIYFR